jgi:hypothetical protein
MPNLKLTNLEILQALGMVMGVSRTPSEWDDETKADARMMIRAGLRAFYNCDHEWNFLERTFAEPASDAYETGTVAIDGAGVVTLTGGTFPSWAVDGILRVDGHTVYVTTRTDDTHLIISHDGLTVAAGTTYALHRWRVGLPDDFAEFLGGVVYSQANRSKLLRGVMNDTQIRLQYAANFKTGDTSLYSVVAGGDTGATSQWYLTFWPTMDSEALVTGTYRASPEDGLDATDILLDDDYVQVGQVHSATILASILAAAEEYYTGQPGAHAAKFRMLLDASIAKDKKSQGPISHADPRIDPTRYSLLYHTPDYSDGLI